MIPRLHKPQKRAHFMPAISCDQSQTEEQSSPRYKTLLNSDADADAIGVYACNAAGVITYYNNMAGELWGCRPEVGDTDEKFCGSHMIYRVNGSSNQPYDECPMADVLTGRVSGVYDIEVHVRRPDGSRLVVIVNIAPLTDDDGVIVGAVNTFCEIPQRAASNGTSEMRAAK